MKLLDGKLVSHKIYNQLLERINSLKNKNIYPKLVVIIVGDRKDSLAYVNMKHKKCQELDIKSEIKKYDLDIDTNTLINYVEQLNKDNTVHGILIQLPLPEHIDKDSVLNSVSKFKDVDGFHTENIGNLALNKPALFYPCTPAGCVELLESNNIEIFGKNITIIGSSQIVGLPLMLMFLYRGGTVSLCNINTRNVPEYTQKADIVISACGQRQIVKKNWLKKDCVVIDVGINSLPDKTKKKGYRLVGDVDFEDVKDKVSAISPVPGGVGPMTIASLMKNTVIAAERHLST